MFVVEALDKGELVRNCLAMFICLCLCACGTIGTVKSALSDPDLQSENLPVRELKVVILTPDAKKMPAIRQLLHEASDALFAQVGVTLAETETRTIAWESRDREEMLTQVARTMTSYDKPYDIALAFQDYSVPELVQYNLLGTWEGVIDDTYRRYIIIRKMDVQVLLHEIGHGFLFSVVHSRALMAPFTIYVVPGFFPLNRSIYLTTRDRKEVLTNKWRDFASQPPVKPSDIRDPIARTAMQR